MWEIIKCSEEKREVRGGIQCFLGFFRYVGSKGCVVYASITEKDGRYGYYINDNYDYIAHHSNDDTLYKTYEECYESMIKSINSNTHIPDGIIGSSIDDVTEVLKYSWELLGIEEEYPRCGFVLIPYRFRTLNGLKP